VGKKKTLGIVIMTGKRWEKGSVLNSRHKDVERTSPANSALSKGNQGGAGKYCAGGGARLENKKNRSVIPRKSPEKVNEPTLANSQDD